MTRPSSTCCTHRITINGVSGTGNQRYSKTAISVETKKKINSHRNKCNTTAPNTYLLKDMGERQHAEGRKKNKPSRKKLQEGMNKTNGICQNGRSSIGAPPWGAPAVDEGIKSLLPGIGAGAGWAGAG